MATLNTYEQAMAKAVNESLWLNGVSINSRQRLAYHFADALAQLNPDFDRAAFLSESVAVHPETWQPVNA